MAERSPVNARCTSCGNLWDTGVYAPMELGAFAKALAAVKCPNCHADGRRLVIAPVRDLEMLDRLTRAICAETCAYRGEPPCHTLLGKFPPETCDEPGCQAQAMAALREVEAANG